ncbi:hypothetical protein EBU71_20160, partial [bacterium]|nr:hypothetical protein [Candidatus Elulimicrobium humile]
YRWFSDDVINFVSPVGKTFPKWVAGPYTLTEYYSPVYNKHIYIFGEIHDVDKDPCQNIPVQSEQVFPVHMFFDYLIREQYARGKVLDIFIETDKLIKGVEFERNDFLVDFITGDALSLLKHYFASYLTVDKIDDPLGYRDTPDGSLMGRLHYTDVRMNPNYRKELSNTRLTPLERCLHAINWIMLGKVYKKTSDEVLHFFNEGQCDVILKYKPENILKDLQTFIERYGILKQVTKVPFDEVRQFLYEKLYDTISIQNIIDQLKLFQNMLYMGASIDDLHTLLHEQIYGDFLIHLMDVYLIARVMKNPEFKNIIIYVGEYHAKTYREWLEELGFYLENSYIPQTESRCINIQMFEPFFEDKPY